MSYRLSPCCVSGKSPCGSCRADKRDGLQGCAFRCGKKTKRSSPALGWSPPCCLPNCSPLYQSVGTLEEDSSRLPCDPTVLPPICYPCGSCGMTRPNSCLSCSPPLTSSKPSASCGPFGPCSPGEPCDPCVPCGPCEPCGPCVSFNPCFPCGPCDPCPRSPYDPAKTCAPCGPPCIPSDRCNSCGPDSKCFPYVPIF